MIKRAAFVVPIVISILALATLVRAQVETSILQIAQTGVGSNGFGTSWRGQDVEFVEDTWLTRIRFAAGGASAQFDEIRLMSTAFQLVTLRSETNLVVSNMGVEAILSQPFLLLGGTRYTVWFHQSGTPSGTNGCNLFSVDPSWHSYHTNVEPANAPGAGEPSYFWRYQYGTNLSLFGFDNLEVSGNLVIGGSAQFRLDAPPSDFAVLLFGLGATDLPFPGFVGPLRLDPALILPASFVGLVPATGTWLNGLSIPNNPGLHGARLYTQAFHDPSLGSGATFSPMELLVIQ